MLQSLQDSKQLLYKYIPLTLSQAMLIIPTSMLEAMEECSILVMTECRSIVSTLVLWPPIG